MEENEAKKEAAATFVSCSDSYLKSRRKKIRRRRRWWMKSLHECHDEYDPSDMLADLVREPPGGFHSFCRMSSVDFELVLSIIGPRISKRDTKMRKAIPPKERLAVTLRYLATGDSFQSLSYLFKFSPQSISKIIPEVCKAIIASLGDTTKLPSTAEEWVQISDRFETKCRFLHCCGALDGRHLIIHSSGHCGTQYTSAKRRMSIVLLALVDSDYCFTYADVGWKGRLSDGVFLQHSLLFQKIDGNKLSMPEDEALYGREVLVPYVFVANDEFALSPRILKPYSEIELVSSRERIFNYRMSLALRVVENAFGVLASVFRVLRKPILLEPDSATLVTMACPLLHNFLRKSSTSRMSYTPDGTFDSVEEGGLTAGSWRQDDRDLVSFLPLAKVERNPELDNEEIRKEYVACFMDEGRIESQDQYG